MLKTECCFVYSAVRAGEKMCRKQKRSVTPQRKREVDIYTTEEVFFGFWDNRKS
jgi:hypothetical protein